MRQACVNRTAHSLKYVVTQAVNRKRWVDTGETGTQ